MLLHSHLSRNVEIVNRKTPFVISKYSMNIINEPYLFVYTKNIKMETQHDKFTYSKMVTSDGSYSVINIEDDIQKGKNNGNGIQQRYVVDRCTKREREREKSQKRKQQKQTAIN